MLAKVKLNNVKSWLILKRNVSVVSGANVQESVRQFEEIPGPKGVLGIGNFYNYFKYFGNYSWDRLHECGFDKNAKYGDIVCERIVPGVEVVWLFDPNDISKIFNDGTGNFPCRRSHLALKKYRDDRPNVYRTAGLLPTNGAEWWKLRSELQKGLSSPQNVRNFLPKADGVTHQFINNLSAYFDDNNVISDMLPEVSRLNLELTCLLAFDEKLNSFSEEQRHPDSRSSKLMESAEITNGNTLPTDQGFQLWRLFETSTYKKIREAQEYMESVAVDLVTKKMSLFENSNEDLKSCSLLQQYMKNPNLKFQDLIGVSGDLLLAGVHTSSFTKSFALHYISKNKRIQDLMYEEALKVLPNANDAISATAVNSEISYTRAVLKETLRLNPISVGIGRILNKDMVLGGYHVPKNTVVVTQNFVSCRLEKNFAKPLEFMPERWIKKEGVKSTVNPFLVIPFGHGSRSCIARRFAEQNILVFLLRLLRNYELEWMGTEDSLDIHTNLINKPANEIRIKFKKR
ncbi:unnamed protein product [Diamesa hyperborea]